jgi:hypothetical protein
MGLPPYGIDMKGDNTCPDCGNETSTVKLGPEPAREICGRFGCEWDGVTLRENESAREETPDGVVIE